MDLPVLGTKGMPAFAPLKTDPTRHDNMSTVREYHVYRSNPTRVALRATPCPIAASKGRHKHGEDKPDLVPGASGVATRSSTTFRPISIRILSFTLFL